MTLIDLIVVVRLVMSLLLGSLLGYERERSGKLAGLRTHALVALGSTLLTVLAIYGFGDGQGLYADAASRLVSNIVVGIGFIGGGAILKQGSTVRGTTTAATLWLTAAIGIAVGMGMYLPALLATGVAYIILTVFHEIEVKVINEKKKISTEDA